MSAGPSSDNARVVRPRPGPASAGAGGMGANDDDSDDDSDDDVPFSELYGRLDAEEEAEGC